MPRSPASPIPLRGPFGGLRQGPATRRGLGDPQRPATCTDCLNVECRQGDVRRRPGLVYHPQYGSRAPYTVQQLLRAVPFMAGHAGGSLSADHPYALLLGRATDAGGAVHGLAWAQCMEASAGGYQSEPVLVPGDNASPHAGYVCGLTALGAALLVRPALASAATALFRLPGAASWTAGPFFLTTSQYLHVDGATPQAGGVPAGTYHWVVTYGNSVTGAESAPSNPATYILGAEALVTLHVQPSFDVGVNRLRLYRKDVTAAESTFYKVADLAYPQALEPGGYMVVNDAVASPEKSKANSLDPLASYVPAAGADACVHRGRLWLDETPDTLFYSEFGAYHRFKLENSLRAGDEAGDRVLRLWPTAGLLLAFKEQSLWQVQGSTPESFQPTSVAGRSGDGNVGLASPHAMLEADGVLYYAANDGLRSFSAEGLRHRSGDIPDLWAAYADPHYRVLGYDPQRKLVLVSGYADESFGVHLVLAYSTEKEEWYRWDLGAGFGLAALRIRPRGRPVLLSHFASPPAGGGDDGVHGWARLREDAETEQRDQPDPNAAPVRVPWHYDLGPADLGSPYPKQLDYAHVEYAPDAAAAEETVVLSVRVDGEAAPGAGEVPLDDPAGKVAVPVGRLGQTFQIRLAGEHAHRPRIVGCELEAEGVGQR